MSIDASTRPTASPIVRVLNEEVRHYHRWCTPSTLVDQERIEDFYASDVSISAGFFGTLVDHTGVFGEAERFAAQAQNADRTMFSVHGSTGSNFIVLRMLALERPDALVLVARNCHHSTINAIKAFGLDFRFLPSPYDAGVRGGAAAERRPGARRRCARYPEALAVVYTSPTYEGLCANTHAIAAAVHDASPEAMLFVDEAWGGHLHFHPQLPPSAMDAGADISVQSTHKLAGGLQQTGLIHWREGRVDSELMEEAFREYVTTSPSYHLLASADAAVRSLAATGREALGACIERTQEFKRRCARASRGCDHLDDPAWVGAPLRARRRLRPGQDHGRAERLRGQRLRRRPGARRARHRRREGGHQHAHVHHDVPARGRRRGATVRRSRQILGGQRAARGRGEADARQPVPRRSTTGP